jgi:type II secretory pathway pseudopilin PulG
MLKKVSLGFTIVETLVVLAIVGLIMVVIFLAVPALDRNRTKNQANKELNTIVTAVGVAQQYYGTTLRLITGNNCSDCACRPPATITDTNCVNNWINAESKISVAGLDISDLRQDPWGSPYLLDENEGEMGPADCRKDTIRSVGPDATYNTSDDLLFQIPLKKKPCP